MTGQQRPAVCVAQETLPVFYDNLNGGGGNLTKSGCVYMYNRMILFYSRNYYIVNQLQFNKTFKELKIKTFKNGK